jgi:hypothetical protein
MAIIKSALVAFEASNHHSLRHVARRCRLMAAPDAATPDQGLTSNNNDG